MQQGKTIQQLTIGQSAEFSKIFTSMEVESFAEVSGDHNPVHLSAEYAATTRFKQRICHGHLVASLFSAILGTDLPGEGSIYLGQSIKYLKPVYLDDTITAKVTVIEIDEEKNRVKCETTAFNQHGDCVITGVAEIMPPRN
ncbi:MAG: enoyl-CoA hydratase [Firmicutes bacterium HGW-Firmicutes-19]|jgi:3-hydroxybutyryl-CoA dehydratase|nr:MAG: enoyl-CoA hydratase [Firmicutes bacterium HGW-Firmicutes-19]